MRVPLPSRSLRLGDKPRPHCLPQTWFNNGMSKRSVVAAAGVIALFCGAFGSIGTGQDKQAKKQSDGADSVRLIDSIQGPNLYKAYCAVCHGPNAKGDGPMAMSQDSAFRLDAYLRQERRRDVPAGQSPPRHCRRRGSSWGTRHPANAYCETRCPASAASRQPVRARRRETVYCRSRFFIEQMDRREIALAAFRRREPAKAADRDRTHDQAGARQRRRDESSPVQWLPTITRSGTRTWGVNSVTSTSEPAGI